jgi:hypothetical protein
MMTFSAATTESLRLDRNSFKSIFDTSDSDITMDFQNGRLRFGYLPITRRVRVAWLKTLKWEMGNYGGRGHLDWMGFWEKISG